MVNEHNEQATAFRAKLDAALYGTPIMLAERSVEAVASASAFALAASDRPKPAQFSRNGNVAVVSITGALSQRAWGCLGMTGDGYDSITERMRAAFADPEIGAVLMRIDSPGGQCAGCFDAVREIRAMATASRKPLTAYVDAMACSAAYALACSADMIIAGEEGYTGSIGVITVLRDRVEQNKAAGLNVRVVASGKLKAVGHPDRPLTDADVAHVREEIDTLAQSFAKVVASARRMSVADVLKQEAAVFIGSAGVSAGLVDGIGSFGFAVSHTRTMVGRPTGAQASVGAPPTPSLVAPTPAPLPPTMPMPKLSALPVAKEPPEVWADVERTGGFRELHRIANEEPARFDRLKATRGEISRRMKLHELTMDEQAWFYIHDRAHYDRLKAAAGEKR